MLDWTEASMVDVTAMTLSSVSSCFLFAAGPERRALPSGSCWTHEARRRISALNNLLVSLSSKVNKKPNGMRGGWCGASIQSSIEIQAKENGHHLRLRHIMCAGSIIKNQDEGTYLCVDNLYMSQRISDL